MSLIVGQELVLLVLGAVRGYNRTPIAQTTIKVLDVRPADADSDDVESEPPVTAVGEDNAGERVLFHADREGEIWFSPDRPGMRLVQAAEPVGRGNSLPRLGSVRHEPLIPFGDGTG